MNEKLNSIEQIHEALIPYWYSFRHKHGAKIEVSGPIIGPDGEARLVAVHFGGEIPNMVFEDRDCNNPRATPLPETVDDLVRVLVEHITRHELAAQHRPAENTMTIAEMQTACANLSARLEAEYGVRAKAYPPMMAPDTGEFFTVLSFTGEVPYLRMGHTTGYDPEGDQVALIPGTEEALYDLLASHAEKHLGTAT